LARRKGRPELELGFEYNFENSFEILFAHLTPNKIQKNPTHIYHTHLTPNKIQKNPTHIFYHKLNIYFYKWV
jgi:hypothetical protein